MPCTISDVTENEQAEHADGGLWTIPNLISIGRLACIPIFLYLLFGRDNRLGAGWLLAALGATDWVDGWIARRFRQVSEIGKVLDPTADRLLFIVGVLGIIIDGSAPGWFSVLVVVREAVIGLAMVIPAFNSISMFLGALIAWAYAKAKPAAAETYVIPVASGLIAGESLLGVAVALMAASGILQ